MSNSPLTTVVTIFCVGVMLLLAYAEWESSFLILVALLSAGWLLILLIALNNVQKAPSINTLLRRFNHKVDLVCQLSRNDATIDDQNVLKAFDELHADVKTLLATKKTRIGRLKREVAKFMHTTTAQNTYRQSLSLRELGYLVETRKRYSKEAPVLAIYKYSGEVLDENGAPVGMYTIMRKDTSLSFPLAIRRTRHSPYPVNSVETGNSRSSHRSVDGVPAPQNRTNLGM